MIPFRHRVIHNNPVADDVDQAMHRLRDGSTDRTTGHLSLPATVALTALNRLYRMDQKDKAAEAVERLQQLRQSAPFEDVRSAAADLIDYVERDFYREIKQQRGRVR